MQRDPREAVPAQVLIYPASGSIEAGRQGPTLYEIYRAVRSRIWWIPLAGFAGAMVAGLMSFLVTPQYRATATYAPAASTQSGRLGQVIASSQLQGLASLSGIGFSGNSDISRLGALLESRRIALLALRGESALPTFFPDKWDAGANKWKPVATSQFDWLLGRTSNGPIGSEPSEQQIVKKFEDARSVDVDKVNNLILVTVTSTNAEVAARLVNRLAYYVNEEERTRTKLEAERAIAFVEGLLQKTTEASLRTEMETLLDEELQRKTLANARSDYVVEVIDPAIVPEVKASPRRLLYVLFGFTVGTSLALTSLIMLWMRQNRLHTPNHPTPE